MRAPRHRNNLEASGDSGGMRVRYRLYSLHGAEFVRRDEIEAKDDLSAVSAARTRGHGDLVEIWRDDRKVRTIVPLHPA